MKAMISRVLTRFGNALHRRIQRRRLSISGNQSFGQRLWTVGALLALQLTATLVQAIGVVFLPSAASFEQIHEMKDGHGYTTSFAAYKSWKQRIQFVSLTSVGMIAATIGVSYFAFIDPRGSFAAACTISADQDITPAYITTNSCESITISADALLSFSGGAIDLQGNGTFTVNSGVNAVFLDGLELHETDSLVLNGDALAPAADPSGLVITAENVTVGASGGINGDGAGCETENPGDGYGPNTGGDGSCTQGTATGGGDATGGGGAHGGNSGQGSQNSSPVGPYGSATNPQFLGASGAGDAGTAGAGGARVTLTVGDTLDVDGTITANGSAAQNGGGFGAGGGAGGSILIDVSTISGAGEIQATGGNGGDVGNVNQQGGGGSGGRIAVFYDNDPEGIVSNLVAAEDVAGGNPGAGSAIATAGNDGSLYSAEFTVPAAPTITQPADAATNRLRTPDLVASNYNANGRTHLTTDWEIADSNTFNPANIVWSAENDPTNVETITANSTNGSFQNEQTGKTVLAPNTEYFVRARYSNSVGDSNWSSTSSFTTTGNVTPNTPTAVSPENGETDISNTPALSASAFSDDDGDAHKTSDWVVYRSTDCTGTPVWSADFSEQLTGITVNTTNGVFGGVLNGQAELPDGYDYSFQVRYTDDYLGDSDYSACSSFSTPKAQKATRDTVETISGTTKGEGVVTVALKDGTTKTWTAFRTGGAAPQIAYGCNEDIYVTVTKNKPGRAIRVYTGEGDLLAKRRVSKTLKPRELAVGEMNGKCTTVDMVSVVKRGKKKIALKVYFYNEKKNTLKFKKRKFYSRKKLRKKKFAVSIDGKRVTVSTKKGQELLKWRPYKKK